MATKNEINDFIDISYNDIDKISMVATLIENFPYCLLTTANDSLTDEQFNNLYKRTLSYRNHFKDIGTGFRHNFSVGIIFGIKLFL